MTSQQKQVPWEDGKSRFEIGDMVLEYAQDPDSGVVGLKCYPSECADKICEKRPLLDGFEIVELPEPWNDSPARRLGSLAQIKVVGDDYPDGYAQGFSMNNSPSSDDLEFDEQTVREFEGGLSISTLLKSKHGLRLEHRLEWSKGADYFTIQTHATNTSDAPVTLEYLSSFYLDGMTPFHEADAPGRLWVHKIHSSWSAEGRIESTLAEDVHLERSWQAHSVTSERFGQVGLLPVHGYFPFAAIEDSEAGVVWGAQLAWAGSWQMEFYRRGDDMALSGGLADREFGHWKKVLQPGGSIESPVATISVCAGSVETLCQRLVTAQVAAVNTMPAVEQSLPIIYNEFCASWGNPTHEHLLKIGKTIEHLGVQYLVIDAGWYSDPDSSWINSQGDWEPSKIRFPEGMAATAEAIRSRGMIPGIWFEFEVCGTNSTVFELADHHLKRDGIPITVGKRRFWDLQDPWVIDYLSKKVIQFLKDHGFGYMKVDYNETIGIGSEHEDSLGEGLRQQVLGIYAFFDRIREALPELVIESCSSGGHRLEPSMIGRTSMSSFSDAHEVLEAPVIAANMHRVMLPRQNQVWAVLKKSDSERRLIYSLASTFLGRMCLSGNMETLSEEQIALVKTATDFYRACSGIIRDGKSFRFGPKVSAYRHPDGWQGIVILESASEKGAKALAVVHGFENASNQEISLELPTYSTYSIENCFKEERTKVHLDGNRLSLSFDEDFSAAVVCLSTKG